MAKQNGIGATIEVDDAAGSAKDISNDITNFDFSTPRAVQDVTGVDVGAMERIALLADFSVNLNGVFNSAAGMSHAVLSTVPSTDAVRTVSIEISGQTLDNECLITDYALTRGNDGALTWTAPGVLADGTVPTWS